MVYAQMKLYDLDTIGKFGANLTFVSPIAVAQTCGLCVRLLYLDKS